ncbi:hypothetical protein Leryth_023728 [Lithospermum erythrorhizon]|nr:hypothetical protein Leryth_023728 [Lithospermum erythrorhizon]
MITLLVERWPESNSTSDLLLERNREQSFVDLLIPSLILLINLLQKLQETKEQHRNTKLMTALLQLHREVSPKLAASVADLTSSYPNFALGLEAVCHLIASALACWPVYGWTPGLFHHLVDSLHATSILALGPKEICSLLCILIDLLPDEGVWLWKHGNPMLSVLRTLAVGTILGPLKERHIRWYLHSACQDKLLSQLTSQLPKIAQIILHCATSTLVVIQDMLRILIVRIARVSVKNASVLVQPIIHNILARLSEDSTLSDIEAYKVYRLLDFLSLLLEHPHAKPLILNESGIKMLTGVLDRCLGAFDSADVSKNEVSMFSWCIPVFKLISLISDGRTFSKHSTLNERCNSENISAEAFVVLLGQILRLCKVLPAGKELMECLSTFRQLGSSSEARMALLSIMAEHERLMANEVNQNVAASEWKDEPPLLGCWTKLLRIVTSKDVFPVYALEAIRILSAGSLCFCLEGESLNLERVAAIKYLFGIKDNTSPSNKFEENMNSIQELKDLLEMSIADSFEGDALMSETVSFARQLLLLLQSPSGVVTAEHLTTNSLVLTTAATASSKFYRITDASARRIQDYDSGDVIDKFLWECPEILRDGLPIKRKMVSLEGPNRRARGDNASTEITTQSSFSRGSVPPVPSGPTRRDTFRQRKPNTSRPPSMHVDDYVARERNADSSNNPNVIAIPRIGSSGRPPSIHVDEFMARQRERHNPVGLSVTDSASQMKSAPPEIKTDTEKTGRSQQLKPDLSDDLQGIDIVFDAEEAETDDKLPFPQPDDILPQSTPAVVEQNSPHSIVEETESDVNESSQFSHLNNPITSNTDENTPSEFSSRMSASRPELPLTREPSITSEKRFPEFMEDSKSFATKTAKNVELAASGSNNGGNYVKSSGSAATPNFYPKTSLHRSGTPPLPSGSQGPYDHKYMPNQPPLPPMPPPATILPVMSQHADTITSQSSPYNLANDVQPSVQPRFHVQQEYLSTSSTLMVSSPQPDSQHARPSHPSPGRPTRHHPPLPPTPPPYSASLHASSVKYATSHSQSYQSIGTVEHQQNATMHAAGLSGIPMGSYQPSPLMPQLLFNRPNSAPNNMFASSSALHNVENVSSMSQNLGINLSTIQPSLGQLQPLQPPQLPRPPPHHLRPLVPASLQSEQGVPLQQSTQSTQMQPLQMLQQSQGSQGHMYYQSQQQGNLMHLSQQQVEHFQQQVLPPQGDSSSQQNDPGMSLHDFFKSPEAIQTLLSDRDKLCQLLEQHPKLMQMLQV